MDSGISPVHHFCSSGVNTNKSSETIAFLVIRGGEGGVYVSRVVAGGQSEKGGLR